MLFSISLTVLCILIVYYIFVLKYMTPISFFLFISYAYAFFPIVLMNYDNIQFNAILNKFAYFNNDDLLVGYIYYLTSTFFVALFLDIKLIKSYKYNYIGDYNEIISHTYKKLLMFLLLLSIGLFFIGLKLYGYTNFYQGYSSIGEIQIGGLGWSIITTADLLFFISIGLLLKIHGIKKILLFTLFIYSLLHLFGGARLMTIIGIIMVFFIYYDFIIKFRKKNLLLILMAILVFLFFGAFRSGSMQGLNISNGFLEFAFVGFGFYNLISQKSFFDFYIPEFINDIVISALPPVFNKYDYLYRNELILNYFPSLKEISPVGGTFFLTDLYLYLGLWSYLFVTVSLYIAYFLLIYYRKIKFSKFRLILSLFISLLSSYFLANLMRNYLIAASSMLFKVIVIFIAFIIIFKAYKIIKVKNVQN